MLAGRKLLLADDSITIQKVVELTFADEGVTVLSVGNGHDAVGRLAEFVPDIVLADVFMPSLNGYEVCEYVKQNASLKHIPVMLLVGSFEPFDEAEARRVGADDILTKPFQSIRRLIDKVGGLVSGKPDAEQSDQIPTAELPRAKAEAEEPERLSTAELEMTTANTQPLPVALRAMETKAAESIQASNAVQQQKEIGVESSWEEQKMQSTSSEMPVEAAIDHVQAMSDDELLELGDVDPLSEGGAEEFVLDIDLDERIDPNEYVEAPEPVWAASRVPAFVEPKVSGPRSVDWEVGEQQNGRSAKGTSELVGSAGEFPTTSAAQFDDTQEWKREPALPATSSETHIAPEVEANVAQSRWERVMDEPAEGSTSAAVTSGNVNSEQLSPEMIDKIARRAVEQLSEKVVREIAWEVVPQLAELLIKRKLEEKESQPK